MENGNLTDRAAEPSVVGKAIPSSSGHEDKKGKATFFYSFLRNISTARLSPRIERPFVGWGGERQNNDIGIYFCSASFRDIFVKGGISENAAARAVKFVKVNVRCRSATR